MGSASRLCAPALANSPRPTGRGPRKATCGGGLFLIHEPTFCLVAAQAAGAGNSDLSDGALAEMAMAGGAFDDLAAEPDLDSFSDGEAIVAG